jgi:hypothetical protein
VQPYSAPRLAEIASSSLGARSGSLPKQWKRVEARSKIFSPKYCPSIIYHENPKSGKKFAAIGARNGLEKCAVCRIPKPDLNPLDLIFLTLTKQYPSSQGVSFSLRKYGAV